MSSSTRPRRCPEGSHLTPTLRFAVAALAFVLAICVSERMGLPQDPHGRMSLPSIAMDWPLLFHVERAAALLGSTGWVLLILWRGAHGVWPTKVAHLEYGQGSGLHDGTTRRRRANAACDSKGQHGGTHSNGRTRNDRARRTNDHARGHRRQPTQGARRR
jgi:hypothetical protein